MKLNIEPFNDFWINCHFAMLYSIMLSKLNCDKNIVYCNNYEYIMAEYTNEKGYTYNSIHTNMLIKELEEKVYVNQKAYWWHDNPDLIEDIKTRIDQNKIVRLSVDMYYWIEDSLLYHKFHSNHHAIITGYDEQLGIMYTLDAGHDGYLEHEVSYEHLINAARHGVEYPSLISDIGTEVNGLKIVYKDVFENARGICKSIDEVCGKFDRVWNLKDADQYDLMNASSNIRINMLGFSYRNHANGLLIKNMFDSAAGKYTRQFENIFEGYDTIKNVILKETKRDCNYVVFDRMKSKFFELLMKEKEVWVEIINDSKLTCL